MEEKLKICSEHDKHEKFCNHGETNIYNSENDMNTDMISGNKNKKHERSTREIIENSMKEE